MVASMNDLPVFLVLEDTMMGNSAQDLFKMTAEYCHRMPKAFSEKRENTINRPGCEDFFIDMDCSRSGRVIQVINRTNTHSKHTDPTLTYAEAKKILFGQFPLAVGQTGIHKGGTRVSWTQLNRVGVVSVERALVKPSARTRAEITGNLSPYFERVYQDDFHVMEGVVVRLNFVQYEEKQNAA